MSAKITVLKKGGPIIATIGAPGWRWDLLNLRAHVMCARAQLRALRDEEEDDRVDAAYRVLTAVVHKLEDMAYELDHTRSEEVS